MSRYFLANKYDTNAKQYIRNEYDVMDHEKFISGKIKLATKYGNDKKSIYENLNFIAFKKSISQETIDALLYNSGSIEVNNCQVSLNAYETKDKNTGEIIINKKLQLIILEASIPSENDKFNKSSPKTKNVSKVAEEETEEQEVVDDEIPF